MTSEVETEIVKAASFKPTKIALKDRQEYLASLVRSVDKMSEDDFDTLSDDAADWITSAIAAMNKKREIPDFIDDDDEETDDDTDIKAEAEAEDAPPDEEGDDAEEADEDNKGDTEEANSETEDDVEQDPDEDTDGGNEAEADEDDESENEAREAAADKKRRAKSPQASNLAEDAYKAEVKKQKSKEKSGDVARYAPGKITGEKDRYGITIGTKTHDAILLYEKGATINQVSEALGGRHRNILKKLAAEGHKLEKDGSTWKITHKSDVAKKAKKK